MELVQMSTGTRQGNENLGQLCDVAGFIANKSF